MPSIFAPTGTALLLAVALLCACAPSLDWRDVRPADSPVQLLMPCKPIVQERGVVLAGQPVRLVLHACSAGGQTWALAMADVNDPARVGAALAALRAAAAANIGAAASGPGPTPLRVPGATPNPGSQRLRLQGKLPDGKAVQTQLVVFTHGTRVFQATAVGEQVPDEAAQTFFDAIRVQP